jgi:hypothetical protein
MKAKRSQARQGHTSTSALTASSSSIPSIAPPSDQVDTSNNIENRDLEIRELAYKLYQERDRTEGQALQDWLDAEATIQQGGK